MRPPPPSGSRRAQLGFSPRSGRVDEARDDPVEGGLLRRPRPDALDLARRARRDPRTRRAGVVRDRRPPGRTGKGPAAQRLGDDLHRPAGLGRTGEGDPDPNVERAGGEVVGEAAPRCRPRRFGRWSRRTPRVRGRLATTGPGPPRTTTTSDQRTTATARWLRPVCTRSVTSNSAAGRESLLRPAKRPLTHT